MRQPCRYDRSIIRRWSLAEQPLGDCEAACLVDRGVGALILNSVKIIADLNLFKGKTHMINAIKNSI